MSRKTITLTLKKGEGDLRVSQEEIEEMVPDADFNFTLLILRDGRKVFVKGPVKEIEEKLAG